jgi:hypothetical protein
MISAIRNTLIGGIALTALAGPALGDDFMALGLGNDTCGEFLQVANEDRQRAPTGTNYHVDRYALYMEYTAGFLTGRNMAAATPVYNRYANLGESHDNFAGIMAWLENYCRQYPLESFIDSLAQLRFTLEKQGGR